MPVPTLGKSKAAPEPPAFNDYNANVPPRGAIAWPTIEHTYRSLGWAEYILPDNSTYFANVELRVTTDVDLRNNRKLEVITDLLDRKRPGETTLPPIGWELWLREAGETPYESMFVKSWISHRDRIVTTEPPTVGGNGQPEPSVPLSEDDSESLLVQFNGVSSRNYRAGHGIQILVLPRKSSCPSTSLAQCTRRSVGYSDMVLYRYGHITKQSIFN